MEFVKLLKGEIPYIGKMQKAMSCYFVGENRKQAQMSNNEFDALWSSIEGESDFTTGTDEEKKVKEMQNQRALQ